MSLLQREQAHHIGRAMRLPVWLPAILGLLGAGVFATAGGWALGLRDAWAFNFLIYAPPPARWIAAGLLLLAGLPWVWSRLARDAGKFAQTQDDGVRADDPQSIMPKDETSPVTPHTRSRGPFAALRVTGGWIVARRVWLLPVALLLFWLGRERTWYGDAAYKLSLLAQASPQTNPYVWKEPLNSLLEYSAAALAVRLGARIESGIALLSILAGLVFLVAVDLLARRLGRSPWQRAALWLALCATGSSQLWFGHIENYSWSTALALLTLALSSAAVRGCAPLWAVGLAGGAAISMHPQAVFVLPGLLALVQRPRWPRQVTTLALSGAVVPLVTLLVLTVGLRVPLPTLGNGFAGDDQLFWTPAQALAPAQLADVAQNLWLIAPLWPLWLVGGLWALRVGYDRTLTLLGLAAAGMLFYQFAFQNDLPRAHDWDLYAIGGPVITLWGAAAWLHVLPMLSLASVRAVRHTLGVGLLFALCYSAAWVGVNAAYTLLRPDPAERDFYARYRLLDLTMELAQATVTPDTPICAEPVGCARVELTEFVMPHTGDRRPTIFAHAPAMLDFTLALPDAPLFLWLSPALDPQAWEWGGDGVTFAVAVVTATGETRLWSQHLDPRRATDRDWGQTLIALNDYRGRTVTLRLITDPGPAGDSAADRAGWGMPWLLRGTLDVRGD